MKAGKLAIRPWLSCQCNENTLVDLPSSVSKVKIVEEIPSIIKNDLLIEFTVHHNLHFIFFQTGFFKLNHSAICFMLFSNMFYQI